MTSPSNVYTAQEIEGARQLMDEYDREIRAGGEPHWPKRAADLLKAVEEAERFTERVTAQGEMN